MFSDLVRDDVFRLETARLWLRWPRLADAPAVQRYSSRREVAEMTARIPHPYPEGEAERFIFMAREANASGRDLILAVQRNGGAREAIGMISLESRLQDRLTLGYALAPEAWGRGFATEASRAIVKAGFGLTNSIEIHAAVWIENPASRRVLEKCGFAHIGAALQGAPARGHMVQSDQFRLTRADWAAQRKPVPGAGRERAAP